MPLGSFWFYLVYDRLPKNAGGRCRGILGATSSMSSAAVAPTLRRRTHIWAAHR